MSAHDVAIILPRPDDAAGWTVVWLEPHNLTHRTAKEAESNRFFHLTAVDAMEAVAREYPNVWFTPDGLVPDDADRKNLRDWRLRADVFIARVPA